MAELLIAQRFSPRDIIGRGSYGVVMEVMDLRLGRLAALKMVRHGTGGLDVSELAAEARAIARLKHPNIARVYDVGDGKDFSWIAMDLIIGEPMSRIRKGLPHLALSETSRLVVDLLSALEHAHDRSIVHRDVKPSNILLEQSMRHGVGEVCLVDFGIARMGPISLETSSDVLGTPAWMAPEQIRGEAIDHRVDLWATGVVLYELLTGRLPFKGGMPGVFTQILSEPHLPPSQVNRDVPSQWDGLIDIALAKPREKRFQSAREMASAIRQIEAETEALDTTKL